MTSAPALALLEAIRAANGYESMADDSQRPLVIELLDAGLVRKVSEGLSIGVKPVAFRPATRTSAKTTDSATPNITASGSTSGLIPPKVTDDPRITKDRG